MYVLVVIDALLYISMKGVKDKTNLFENVTSLEALFSAWNEFKKGKENKLDVQTFFCIWKIIFLIFGEI